VFSQASHKGGGATRKKDLIIIAPPVPAAGVFVFLTALRKNYEKKEKK